MRKSTFIAIALIGIYGCASNKKALNIRKEFAVNLNILDSAAKLYKSDTVTCCSNSIAFMVENTDVKISAKGTTYGFLFFTKSELGKWHEYYKYNILKKKH